MAADPSVADEPTALAVAAAMAAAERTDAPTVVLDIADISSVASALVITSGRVDRQVRAIAEHVEESLADHGVRPLRVEGLDSLQWVLIDYGGVVVHVFDEDARAFYDLERLWRDAPAVDWA